MRLRICSAKCGVEAPISWRTSSTVGSRIIRSGRSYSLMRTGTLPPGRLIDRHEGGGRVDPVLRGRRQRVGAAEDPHVVVDPGRGVAVRVPRLEVEQVALERTRQV